MQTQQNQSRIEDDRTSVSVEALKRSMMNHLFYLRGKLPETATTHDYYVALVYTVRDRLLSGWMATTQAHRQPHVKRVVYLSSDLLTRTALATYLINLRIHDQVCQAIEEFGLSLEELLQQDQSAWELEERGQLITHHLDSLTTLEIPAMGYGIRYEAEPESVGDCQTDIQGTLYCSGNPWEISRPEQLVAVQLGGHTEARVDEHGRFCVQWFPEKIIHGIPYDTPISGYRTNTVNTMRLWSALRVESADAETRSEIELLQQQYFLIACSLQDMLRVHCIERKQPIETLADTFTLQLYGSQQSIAIAELMRLLLDEHRLDWDTAWRITQATIVYTHHTSLIETTKNWTQAVFQQMLPRHLELIYEINQRFLSNVRDRLSIEDEQIRRLSLINEREEYLRLSHLAFVGSHIVNETTAISSKRLPHESLRDFQALFPDKFKSQANRGISHRSLLTMNPPLARLITRSLGKHWIRHCQDLSRLEALMESAEFCQSWRSIKLAHKQTFADWVLQTTQTAIDPQALLDVQIQPISEPQRQLLSVLYIITLYGRLKLDPARHTTPRTFIFNTHVLNTRTHPASPFARLIAQLIEAVAQVVNRDPDLHNQLKVVCFKSPIADMNTLYAAADLTEQIATANTAVFDLSNLTLGLNGALTIGTLNEASLVLRHQIGEGNFFLFGLTAEEIIALKSSGYDPWYFYQNNRELQRAIDRIATGYFTTDRSNWFKPLIDAILERDEYLLLADYPFYVDCQDQIAAIYADEDWWTRLSILNSARIGQSACDRIIQEYCQHVWAIKPVPIEATSLGNR